MRISRALSLSVHSMTLHSHARYRTLSVDQPAATTLVAEQFQKLPSPGSTVSLSKTVALANREPLAFPPAPKTYARRKHERMKAQRQTGQNMEAQMDPDAISELEKQEVTCPYCFEALSSQAVFDETKWQAHVKNDLDPYVCLFSECDQPGELYSHGEEWLKHMHIHVWRWRCTSHNTTPFSSREEYINHLREVHKSRLGDMHLRVLAGRTAQTAGKLFETCPLCGHEPTDGRLIDHVVGHLRSLALKSLPSCEEVPDDSEDEYDSFGTSSPQSRSTIKDMELFGEGLEVIGDDLSGLSLENPKDPSSEKGPTLHSDARDIFYATEIDKPKDEPLVLQDDYSNAMDARINNPAESDAMDTQTSSPAKPDDMLAKSNALPIGQETSGSQTASPHVDLNADEEERDLLKRRHRKGEALFSAWLLPSITRQAGA
ncbi:hypothetical protein B0T10DRAFT_461319 [Thelonectria olida]|uniref:C2H2-type domain-containing protein n=1 Tax=Thelonectria olida TaxID=1576542 RepID=A0A9P8W1S6_9HYPO|nr:hypothetical protein B0T10DRAFT_461319 [Thelonectria olida]